MNRSPCSYAQEKRYLMLRLQKTICRCSTSTRIAVQHGQESLFNFAGIGVQHQQEYAIGCGFGDKTLSIIKAIQKYHPVKAIALDPSSQLLSMFKEEVSDQTIDIICSTWGDYHPVTNFEFISSIHTFYYIDNWERAILKMIDNLEKDGKICIALRSNDSVCQFRDYFYKKIHNDGRKERNCQELCELLKQLNIQYKIDYVDSVLDISDCLIENEKGRQLIEFILRQPYENLYDISNEIISYLHQVQNNDHLAQRDGYIWISKQ